MASCNVCQTQGLVWSENVNSQGKHYLYNENTGQSHACKPKLKPNPILIAADYVIVEKKKINLGFWADLREDKIAELIVNEALRCGLDPFKVKAERKGNFIILH